MKSFAVRKDLTDQLRAEYESELEKMSLSEAVREFFSYLEYTEESDSGHVFHPITIGSCRVLLSDPLHMVLGRMKELAKP